MKQIILASSSPRRKELLEKIGLEFTVDPSNYEEVLEQKLSADQLAIQLATGKAEDVAKKYNDAIIIGGDTVVTLAGKHYEKPKDTEDAKNMLQELSGKQHEVATAYCVIDTQSKKKIAKCVTSYVWIKELTQQEINAYVATGEPMDKAGSYAMQEKGMMIVKRIEGNSSAVVGLPIFDLVQTLKKFGIDVWILQK